MNNGELPLTSINSELNDIERGLLGLDVDDEAHPLPSRAPSSSPNRPKYTAHSESESLDNHRLHANHNDEGTAGSDGDSGAAAPPKKRPRSNRRIPAKEEQIKALDLLNSRRKSKAAPKIHRGAYIPKKSRQPRKTKKPRRLPVDELVTASQRFEDSGQEDDGKSKHSLAVLIYFQLAS